MSSKRLLRFRNHWLLWEIDFTKDGISNCKKYREQLQKMRTVLGEKVKEVISTVLPITAIGIVKNAIYVRSHKDGIFGCGEASGIYFGKLLRKSGPTEN